MFLHLTAEFHARSQSPFLEQKEQVSKTKNQLMVTIHSKDVTEILALYRRSEIDFPPHFLVRLMHSFPMMYNTI